jgi:hypothetical protein
VFGAAVLGLAMALLVIAVEQMLMWNRPRPDHHGANA